ncbi:MAG: hypothetical protein ACE15F_03200 [bacterium]
METVTHPITRRSVLFLFWGLLCTQLDFRVEGFDAVFPDCLGYILFARGLRELRDRPAFRAAWILAIGLAVFSLVTLYERPTETGLFNGYDNLHFFLMIFDLIMVWQTIGGIMELAKERSNPKLADTAQLRRLLYVAMVVSPMFLSALTPAQQEFVTDYFHGYLILVYGVILAVLDLLRRAGIELSGPEPTPGGKADPQARE